MSTDPVSGTATLLHSDSPSPDDSKWCALPTNFVWRIIFKVLCTSAISKPSVEHWEELRLLSSKPKQTQEHWEKHKKLVINRFENMNVTAGLVLASSAVFMSTNPPMQSLIPYANYVSYTLEGVSFIAALFSLMTGTSVLVIYDTCYAHEDILGSFKESRLRLVFCLMLMAFPSLALVISTVALMIAIYVACFTSDKLFMKVLATAACALSIFLAAIAFYVFNAPIKKAIHGKASTDSHPEQGSTIAASSPPCIEKPNQGGRGEQEV